MKRVLSLIMVGLLCTPLISIFIPHVKGQEMVVFQDDFESYAVGTFPSSGGWQIVWNGAGNQYQVVTDSYYASPIRSLQLMGSYGWSVVVKKDFSSSSNVIGYEAKLLASEGGGGSVAFCNIPIAEWGRYYAMVGFGTDGFIWACSRNNEQYQQLQPFTPYTWYKVRAVVDRTAKVYDVWIDDVLRGQNIPIYYDPWEILSLQFQVGWVDIKNYFDDVKVFESGEAAVHDVAVTNVVASQSQVTVGDLLPVSVTAENFGMQTETFSVMAYFGSGKIGFDVETVTLGAGERRVLDMIWDTTGVVPNSYQIGAYASQAPGETNLANNDYQDGTTVIVGLPYPPKNLVAKPINNAVNLTWSVPDKSGVQNYYIFRGTNPDFEISWPNYHAVVDGSKQQFVDTISDNTIYYYEVIASYSEGFSRPSDIVGCARLESFKGIANDLVGTSTLTVLNSWTCATFQQNFFINTSDAGGNRKYYWCQNCVVKAMNFNPLHLPFVPKGYATGLMYVWGPVDSIGQINLDTPKTSKPDWPYDWKFCPDEINFSSYIDGSSLVMHNSLWGPERFDLGLSSDAYIHTIPTDYPPDSSMLYQVYCWPPNLVLVGDLGGGHANFTSGTGHVSCRTKIGDYWHQGTNIAVVNVNVNKDRAKTKETSEGLSWDMDGYFSSQVHSFDEGVFFVPDFDTPVIGPLTFNTVSNSACVLTVQAKCPVYLKLYDNLGKFIGFDATSGFVEAQIPTAVWRSNQSICIFDPSGTYYLMAVGIESGTYTLQISWQNETGCLILCNSTETIGKDDSPSWILSSTASGSYVVMENTPLSVSINPLSGSTLVGQSVTFTSTVSGGITPYNYQWYLNGNPVSGATSNAWAFTPATSGIYYVYLKVTDAVGNTKQSETARITVATVPVGGYSIPIQRQTTGKALTPYLILIVILTITFTSIKRKTTRKTKQQ